MHLVPQSADFELTSGFAVQSEYGCATVCGIVPIRTEWLLGLIIGLVVMLCYAHNSMSKKYC